MSTASELVPASVSKPAGKSQTIPRGAPPASPAMPAVLLRLPDLNASTKTVDSDKSHASNSERTKESGATKTTSPAESSSPDQTNRRQRRRPAESTTASFGELLSWRNLSVAGLVVGMLVASYVLIFRGHGSAESNASNGEPTLAPVDDIARENGLGENNADWRGPADLAEVKTLPAETLYSLNGGSLSLDTDKPGPAEPPAPGNSNNSWAPDRYRMNEPVSPPLDGPANRFSTDRGHEARYDYPRTDPTTYRYPSDEQYLPAAQDDVRPPATATLRGRIEPPDYRGRR